MASECTRETLIVRLSCETEAAEPEAGGPAAAAASDAAAAESAAAAAVALGIAAAVFRCILIPPTGIGAASPPDPPACPGQVDGSGTGVVAPATPAGYS